jgi:hypothetical protein
MKIFKTFLLICIAVISLSSFKITQQKPSEMILGIWKISDVVIADMPVIAPSQKAAFEKELKTMKDSSSFEMKADGTYHQINWAGGKVHSDGKWKLSNDAKQLIITNKDGQSDTLDIISLTTHRLVCGSNQDRITYVK